MKRRNEQYPYVPRRSEEDEFLLSVGYLVVFLILCGLAFCSWYWEWFL